MCFVNTFTPSDNSSKICPILPSKPTFPPFFPPSPICSAHIFLGVWPFTGAWSIYQGQHFQSKLTLFFFLYWLLKSSWLTVQFDVYLPYLWWDFVWLVNHWELCLLSQSLWVHTYGLPVASGGYYLLMFTHCLWDWQSFFSFFQNDPWALVQGYVILMLSLEQRIVVFYLCIFTSCRFMC